MTKSLTLAYSPCPNDTIVYGPLALGEKAIPGVDFSFHLHDVETLNRYALEGRYDITKVSCQTYLKIRDRYQLLDVGAAIGYGCGPLVIAKEPMPLKALHQSSVVFPGELTTAYALFKMLEPNPAKQIFTPYDTILPMVSAGETDCGVIIHESRFTYQSLGLHCLIDLGAWWENETGLPLPMGCAVIKKELYDDYAAKFESLVREQLDRKAAPSTTLRNYIQHHAQDIEAKVIDSHIELYVNDFTASLGDTGRKAINALEQRSYQSGTLLCP
jgi:5,8-dihydroxy-2-naphthoate synthase